MARRSLRIKTKYFAFIRERLRKESEDFVLDEGVTVADFLKFLNEKYGETLRNVFEKNGLRTGFALALNGENLDRSLWNKTFLKDGDVVVILPPIAGGIYLKLGSLTPLCP